MELHELRVEARFQALPGPAVLGEESPASRLLPVLLQGGEMNLRDYMYIAGVAVLAGVAHLVGAVVRPVAEVIDWTTGRIQHG